MRTIPDVFLHGAFRTGYFFFKSNVLSIARGKILTPISAHCYWKAFYPKLKGTSKYQADVSEFLIETAPPPQPPPNPAPLTRTCVHVYTHRNTAVWCILFARYYDRRMWQSIQATQRYTRESSHWRRSRTSPSTATRGSTLPTRRSLNQQTMCSS